MAWVKTETFPFATDNAAKLQFADWLFQTLLPRRGWTFVWKEGTTGDSYYALKRTYTTQTGATLDCSIVYEIEPVSSDMVLYAWDGLGDYEAFISVSSSRTLISDSSWAPIIYAGVIDVWEDEGSDGFFLHKRGASVDGIFGLQLPDGGYLDMSQNSANPPGSRPYYWNAPVLDIGCIGAFIDVSSTNYRICSTEVDRPNTVINVWQDYTAVGINNGSTVIKIWEDLSEEWKMESYRLAKVTSSPTVTKIDARYYLDIGPFLIPAGTTEPSI